MSSPVTLSVLSRRRRCGAYGPSPHAAPLRVRSPIPTYRLLARQRKGHCLVFFVVPCYLSLSPPTGGSLPVRQQHWQRSFYRAGWHRSRLRHSSRRIRAGREYEFNGNYKQGASSGGPFHQTYQLQIWSSLPWKRGKQLQIRRYSVSQNGGLADEAHVT